MQRAHGVPLPDLEVGLWQDALELPEALAATLRDADGFDDVSSVLSHRSVRRIVVAGNGASHYVGLNLWLASLCGGGRRPRAQVVAIPAGLLATGHFAWQSGDVLVAVSSSGEFRDVVDAVLDDRSSRPCVAITASPDSTIGTRVSARALVSVVGERAVTHTQAYCGAVVASLAIWARLTGDKELELALHHVVERYATLLASAGAWASERLAPLETPAAGVSFGSGPAFAAALEAALLMKEVARVPWEGAETREGATSAMYSLGPGQLVLAIGSEQDPLLREAELACSRAGATVLRLPETEADVRLTALTSFPTALVTAITFGRRRGLDVDRPGWIDGYYATARPADAHAPTRAMPVGTGATTAPKEGGD